VTVTKRSLPIDTVQVFADVDSQPDQLSNDPERTFAVSVTVADWSKKPAAHWVEVELDAQLGRPPGELVTVARPLAQVGWKSPPQPTVCNGVSSLTTRRCFTGGFVSTQTMLTESVPPVCAKE
jgi:hypothetical protein